MFVSCQKIWLCRLYTFIFTSYTHKKTNYPLNHYHSTSNTWMWYINIEKALAPEALASYPCTTLKSASKYKPKFAKWNVVYLRPGPGNSPKPKSSPLNWSATAANYAVHHEVYLEGIGTKMEPFINIQGKSRISHFPRRNWYKSTEAVFAMKWLLLYVCLWILITYMNLQAARNCISSVCIGNVCRPK